MEPGTQPASPLTPALPSLTDPPRASAARPHSAMVATDARPSSRSPQPTREADCISALCCHFIMNGVLVVLYSLLLAAVNDELEGEKVRATVAASPARVCVSGNPPLGAGVITASAIHGVDILFLSCSWLVRGSAQCGVPGDDVRLWGSVAGSVGIANSIVDFLLASAVCLTDSHHRVLFLVIGSILGAVLSLFEVAWGAFGASASSDSKLAACPADILSHTLGASIAIIVFRTLGVCGHVYRSRDMILTCERARRIVPAWRPEQPTPGESARADGAGLPIATASDAP